MGSPFLKFNINDLWGVVKTALMVGAAAALTFLLNNLGQIEMGPVMLMIIPIVTAALQSAIKFLQDGTKEPEPEPNLKV